jgi:hypothetical protein
MQLPERAHGQSAKLSPVTHSAGKFPNGPTEQQGPAQCDCPNRGKREMWLWCHIRKIKLPPMQCIASLHATSDRQLYNCMLTFKIFRLHVWAQRPRYTRPRLGDTVAEDSCSDAHGRRRIGRRPEHARASQPQRLMAGERESSIHEGRGRRHGGCACDLWDAKTDQSSACPSTMRTPSSLRIRSQTIQTPTSSATVRIIHNSTLVVQSIFRAVKLCKASVNVCLRQFIVRSQLSL